MIEPTHVYMNLDLVNNSKTKEQPLVFSETRNIPFLVNSNHYFASVIRFTLQTSNSLPVFIPDILVGQNDCDKTVYDITMTLKLPNTQLITKSLYISYHSKDETQPTPSAPTTTVDRSSTYYWIYNISDWVDLINETLSHVATHMRTATANLPIGNPYKNFTFNDPFIDYDLSSGLFTLCNDTTLNTTGAQAITCNIYFNARLYNILPFPATRTLNAPVNQDYKISMSKKNTKTILTDDNVRQVYDTSTTEFSPVCLLNPIRNIFFTTNTLPILPTLTQPPKVLTDGIVSGNSGLPDILNVITDFEIPVTAVNNYNGELIYQPAAEYRLISMNTGFNLNKIDLACYWKDRYGATYQMKLVPGAAAALKLMFRHKAFNMERY